MPALDGFKLTIQNADVDNDGSAETGVFRAKHNIMYSFGTRTGPIGEGGSQLWSIIASWYEDQTGSQVLGDGKRQQLRLDLGAGAHTCELDFKGFEGSSLQWGDPTEAVGSPANATGEHVIDQMQVLDRFLQVAEIDSRDGHAATLEVGEYSENGRYNPINVAPEDPEVTFDSENQSSVFSGSITFVEIATLGDAYDATQRQE
jgi:hypothetical protein